MLRVTRIEIEDTSLESEKASEYIQIFLVFYFFVLNRYKVNLSHSSFPYEQNFKKLQTIFPWRCV